ncbi:MAG: hypothetical protein EON49_02325 [Acidovorax sp.]|nr:MAG: hypothetical protein EON49_02325 [Acidovorax sp.]
MTVLAAAGEGADPGEVPGGPLLPPGLLQPLDLRYEYAEMHVMLYLHAHQDYESVEAMISPAINGERQARVILTRHDQTQVDHVSDQRVLRDVAGLSRQVVLRTIGIDCRIDQSLPEATLSLQSWRGELIVFTLRVLAPPDAARGGLTDPGEHSAHTSLPVMLRERSTIAGPGSGVMIDGRAVALSALPGGGPGRPMTKGFLTLGHHLPILRASERMFILPAASAEAPFSQGWTVDDGRSVRRFNVRNADARGRLTLACEGERPEIVHTVRDATGLRLIGVDMLAAADPGRIARLTFSAAGTFSIGIGARNDLVVGRWRQESPEALTLTPIQPAWAVSRPVTVAMRHCSDRIVVRTTIG